MTNYDIEQGITDCLIAKLDAAPRYGYGILFYSNIFRVYVYGGNQVSLSTFPVSSLWLPFELADPELIDKIAAAIRNYPQWLNAHP